MTRHWSDALPALLQQLAQPLDHPHRFRCGVRRDAGVERVIPDAAQAELLRRLDFPLVIVADHPGVAGIAAQPLQRMPVDVRFGLAPAELAPDLDRVEARPEPTARDLG